MTRLTRRWALLGLTALAILAACDAPARTATVRGVLPVGDLPVPRFRLADRPLYSISEATEPVAFQLIDIDQALLLAGDVVVLNNGWTGEMIRLAPSGIGLGVSGRIGDGPGELSLRSVLFPGPDGGYAVGNERGYRVSVFDSVGRHRFDISTLGHETGVWEGWLEGEGPVTRISPEAPDRTVDTLFHSHVIFPPERGEEPRVVVGARARRDAYVVGDYEDGSRVTWSISRVFRPQTDHAVIGDHVVEADSGAGTIALVGADGSRRVVFRYPWPRRSFDEEVISTFVGRYDFYLELSPEGRDAKSPEEWAEAARRVLSFAGEYLPAWVGMVPDATGRVWLARDFGDGPQRRWLVVTLDGEVVGEVRTPSDRQVLAVRGDRVLTRWTDEVEQVWAELYEVVVEAGSG